MTSPNPYRPLRTGVIDQGPTVVDFPANASFGPRNLHDFEFVWILHGGATCTIDAPGRERRVLHLTPGTLLLAQPGMTDEYRWRADGPSQHAYVHFALADDEAEHFRFDWPLTRPLGADDPMAALCHFLTWLPGPAARHEPNAVASLHATLDYLLGLFVNGPFPSAGNGTRHTDRLASWLATTWRSAGVGPVPVPELARGIGVSTGHLSRICRSEFGVGPGEVVELLRLGRAASLLRRSNLGVAQVAAACGFADAFHFSRRFRRAYGMPPSRFRFASGEAVDPLAVAQLLPIANRVIADDPVTAEAP